MNSAIVALYGYLQADKAVVVGGQKAIWLSAIPVAGMIVCAAWARLITSYRQLNRAKFTVLQELEAELPLQPFRREHEVYSLERRHPLSVIETAIPACFALLYLVMLLATVIAG